MTNDLSGTPQEARIASRLRPASVLLLAAGLLLASPHGTRAQLLQADPSQSPLAPALAVPGNAPATPGVDTGAAAAPADTSAALPGTPAGGTVEAVSLSVQGIFTAPSARVGDSLDYVLRVEWPDIGVPVMVLAPDSLDFPGFAVIGQSTQHRKLASASGIANRTEFVYRLRARTAGGAKASSMRLRYLSGVSRTEESVFVPAAHLDIAPARKRPLETWWGRLLLGALVLVVLGALARAAFRLASRRRQERTPARDDLRPEVLALKPRLRGGDSRAILLAMEGLCVRHLRQALDGASPAPAAGAQAPRFEVLLDRYLARDGAEDAEGWKSLRELFLHARFAGGHKEPHELQEAYRVLKRCLKIKDEPGDE